jgi:hypothetical protein
MRRLTSFLFAILAIASGASPAPDLEITIEPEGSRRLVDPGANVGPVFFADEPVTIHVSVAYESSATKPDDAFAFPTRQWLDALQLHVYDQSDGVEVAFTARPLDRIDARASGDARFVLRDGDNVGAAMELSGLRPGNYRIEGQIGAVTSLNDDRGLFTVRRGDEDVETIRLHYRYRADRASSDFRAYERVMRELLARYEPGNAGILVQIADRSVDRVPVEETVRYYREARTVLDAKWRAELAAKPDTNAVRRRRMEQAIRNLTIFERVLPYYLRHRDELRFGHTVIDDDTTAYAWLARKGGRKLGVIDPARPDAWRKNAHERP